MFTNINWVYFAAPILDIAQNDFVQSKVEEAAKLFYNNANVTINLVPALVGGGLLLLLLIPLLALLFQPAAETSGSGYGAPAAEYGAPSSTYGSPSYSRSVSSANSLHIYMKDWGFGSHDMLREVVPGKISALCGTFALQPLLTVCYGLDIAFDCLSLYSPIHNH